MRSMANLGYALLLGALGTATVVPAHAVPFDAIRIGDQDGFGFTDTAGLVNTSGDPADTNGNGRIEQTEFLPDLNANGTTATRRGDDFDNRSAAEAADTGLLGGSGYTDDGSTGFQWTDVSLSTSFGGRPGTANAAEFTFDFFVAGEDIDPATSEIFFNLIFGDYDVSPARVALTLADETVRDINLSLQGGTEDGLVQAATATLAFEDVFTAATDGWDGFLNVDFIAPNEPYVAFDFVELSLTQIPFEPTPPPTGVPGPAPLSLLCAGVLGLAWRLRNGDTRRWAAARGRGVRS